MSSAGSPQQRAGADAAALLTAFVSPPGARRLPAAPVVPGGYLLTQPDSFVEDVLSAAGLHWPGSLPLAP
ncbi:MAG TPA: hypothetical protein VH478_13115 [Trebonia sp.]|nr:hypothetical protein [Trebonia sp.]